MFLGVVPPRLYAGYAAVSRIFDSGCQQDESRNKPWRALSLASRCVGLRLVLSLRKMSVLLTPGDVKKSFCPRNAAAHSPGGI